MEDRGETTKFAAIESLTGWWELAGMDSAVSDTAVNWLADEALDKRQTSPAAAAAKKVVAPAEKPSIVWPTDIATLRDMVTSGAPLPGNAYGPVRFASIGPENAGIMVISDLPDILVTPETAKSPTAVLMQRMLASIGINAADCYRSWLATSMPSTGEVPEQDLHELAAFMLHQIKLVTPSSIVILGSSACKSLLNDELMNARAQLRNINHNGLNITTLATFHPRTLIARPAMKKQAWRDLQMFAKRAVQ